MKAIAWFLNRNASKGNPFDIIRALKIKQGFRIADIGSGGGYFTLRFSEIVGDSGVVYAVDSDTKMLSNVKNMIVKNKIKNIVPIISQTSSVRLPQKVDLVFMRNVYHHLTSRVNYFKSLKDLLTKDGCVAIVDYSGRNKFNWITILKHFTKPETIKSEMEKAGYKMVEELGFLKNQSFMIFKGI